MPKPSAERCGGTRVLPQRGHEGTTRYECPGCADCLPAPTRARPTAGEIAERAHDTWYKFNVKTSSAHAYVASEALAAADAYWQGRVKAVADQFRWQCDTEAATHAPGSCVVCLLDRLTERRGDDR